MREPVAQTLRPLVQALLGADPTVAIRFWDGSRLGPDVDLTDGPHAVIVIRSPDAIRRLLYAPNELGLARAYVAGDLDVEGDIYTALSLREAVADPADKVDFGLSLSGRLKALGAARAVGALGRPLPAPKEEARLGGRLHSKSRDAAAISHHYDVSNDFYRLVLGPTHDLLVRRTSPRPDEPARRGAAAEVRPHLPQARPAARHAPARRRLRLGRHGDARRRALRRARRRHHAVAAAGRAGHASGSPRPAWPDRVEIRLQDYRDLDDGPFDAI